MIVKKFMTPDPVTISPEEDINDAFHLLLEHRFRQAPVVEDGKLIGIVTDRDLRTALFQTYVESDLTVGDVMRAGPVTISEDSEVKDAARIICECKFNALPVVSGTGDLVGIITTTDILRGVLKL
ncbi:MAG TPA: CBS domain-containing protein [Thermodesulfobacteriota bacterium]|jgi:acetoin utilization protein AcuB